VNARKIFIADTGGAIMVVGVFMTLFLIGGLFFLLGIGDALVFHDHMQEVADVSAFTGAVVHARFMNLIAAINLIMLALVVIHLALALLHLGTLILNVLACVIDLACPVPIPLAACLATVVANNLATIALEGYDALMKGTLLALSAVQYGLAWTAWIAAPAASVYVASNYKSHPSGPTVLGLSEGLSIPFLSSGRIGLPVNEEEPGFLCEKLISYFTVPGLGAASSVLGFAGAGIRALFCSGKFDKVPHWNKCFVPTIGPGLAVNGSWWTEKNKGPKKMWEYTGDPLGNGSDWNSVYGAAIPEYSERADKSVAVGGMLGSGGGPAGKNEKSEELYFAQAEFYYDCTKTWTDPKCEDKPKVDNAMYSIGWRARLVRFHLPRVLPIPAASFLNKILRGGVIH
jgi:hypothetical protein